MGKIFFSPDFGSKNERFLRTLSQSGRELIETTERILLRLSDTETPQGVVAVASCRPVDLREVTLRDCPLVVICDGTQDPGNLGTIIRTSDAAGADAVILLSGTCDPFAPKVIRATAGSIFNLPVIRAKPDIAMEWLRGKSISLFVTETDASTIIYDADLRRPVAFVFGNEARGVSRGVKEQSDVILRIPLLGRAESLNVAAACAVCLYEAVRQRTAE